MGRSKTLKTYEDVDSIVKELIKENRSGPSLRLWIAGLAMAMTIVFQGHNYLGKFGWLMFAILCGMNTSYAIYAAFFFAAFFRPSGFFPDLFFTIKHFHIAIWLLIFIQFLKGNLTQMVRQGLFQGLAFLPWVMILVISAFSAFYNVDPLQAFRTTGNISLVIFNMLVLICAIDKESIFLNGLMFFIMGACLRIMLALSAIVIPTPSFLVEGLFYNNHLGFLSASAIFLLLPFMFTKHKVMRTEISWLLLATLLSGLVLSCSRTGWVSFTIVFVIFTALFWKLLNLNRISQPAFQKKRLLTMILLALLVVIGVSGFINKWVLVRIWDLIRLFNLEYLNFTIHDHVNFGFLGIIRLHQFYVLKEILQAHWITGMGFSRTVTDLHSLYLTIAGAAGGLGAYFFVHFIVTWIHQILRHTFYSNDRLNAFRIGAFCSFLIWLLYSVMETFIIQFDVWLIITAGIILTKSQWLGTKAKEMELV